MKQLFNKCKSIKFVFLCVCNVCARCNSSRLFIYYMGKLRSIVFDGSLFLCVFCYIQLLSFGMEKRLMRSRAIKYLHHAHHHRFRFFCKTETTNSKRRIQMQKTYLFKMESYGSYRIIKTLRNRSSRNPIFFSPNQFLHRIFSSIF